MLLAEKQQQRSREQELNTDDGKKAPHTTILVHGGTGPKIKLDEPKQRKPRGTWEDHPRMKEDKGEFPTGVGLKVDHLIRGIMCWLTRATFSESLS